MHTHVAVGNHNLVLVLENRQREGILKCLVAHVVEHGHAVEDAVGVVHVEYLAVTAIGLGCGILIAEVLTCYTHIDAVLVAGQVKGMVASGKFSVDDIAVFVTIHELAALGGEVQTRGATQLGGIAADGGIAHNVQILPLGSLLVFVNRGNGNFTLDIALRGVEHAVGKHRHADIEHAQALDSSRYATGLQVVGVGGNFHLFERGAALEAVAHHVGRSAGQYYAGELRALCAQTLWNLVATLGDDNRLQCRA